MKALVIAGIAIGIGSIALFSIFALPSLFRDNQIIQLNKGISGSGPKMIVPYDSGHIYSTWISRIENQNSNSSNNLFNLYFSYSRDGGTTFSQPVVIGNSTEFQDIESLFLYDNYVYIIWNDGDIFFAKSSNSGQTFSDPVNLSNSSLQVRNPSLTASGNSVFVAWVENTPELADGRIFFRASHNYGANFGDIVNLYNALNTEGDSLLGSKTNVSAGNPKIAATNQTLVLISWTEYYTESDSVAPKLVYSTDGGKIFRLSYVTSDANDGAFLIQSMQTQGNHIYLVLASDDRIFLSKSTFEEGNLVFSEPAKIAQNNERSAFFGPPQVIKMLFEGDDSIYILYTGEAFEAANYYFTSSSDGGKTFGGPLRLFGYDYYHTDMAADGEKVYVVRTDSQSPEAGPSTTIHLLVSTNGGMMFEQVYDIKAEQNSTFYSPDIEIAKEPDAIYLLWNEVSEGESKILFTKRSN